MGRKVLITYKLMPESVDTDLNAIKKSIEESIEEGEIKDIQEEPVAFGLKAIKVLIMVEDKEGIADTIENKLNNIEGVESVETEGLTLI